ncbi:MAG: DASS family sodium-coupled anion symporter [Planctomycetes bacterium]|nr:DASS family sodium-coupled anion symporter [Planctomycetota bacterium]
MKTATRTIILLVAFVIAAWLAFGPTVIPSPDHLHPQSAQRALAVFVVCLSLWFTHSIPLAVTGMLAFALLPLLKVTEPQDAFKHLGSQAVMFMLGVFFLTAAMIATGLSKRLTLLLLHRMDSNPRDLFNGVLTASVVMALCMPEHAVAAMMFPIVLEIVQALGLKPGRSNYARLLFLALAWGAVIGGVGTVLGGARAPLAISFYNDFTGENIGFFTWMIAALPIVVILTLVARVLLPRLVPIDITDVSRATKMIRDRVAHLGKMQSAERRLMVLSLATIACWIGLGHYPHIGLAVISIASACLLFVLRIVTWNQIQDYINWGVLLMYGGALAIGGALHETGAMAYLVGQVFGQGLSPKVIMVLVALVALLLTECISNAAAVAVLLPIGYSICATTDIDPLVMTLGVTIMAGLPFALPVSSPPHAIAFSSGYYSVSEAYKPGLIMNICAVVVFVVVMLLYWPMIL